MIDRLKAIGAEPPVAKAAPASSKPAKKVVPSCPIHHTLMKASRKPSSIISPRRSDDGYYCPEKS